MERINPDQLQCNLHPVHLLHILGPHIVLQHIFPFSCWLILSKFLHIMGLRHMQFLLVVIYMQAPHIGAIRFGLLPLHPAVSCKQTNKQRFSWNGKVMVKFSVLVIYMQGNHQPPSSDCLWAIATAPSCLLQTNKNKLTEKAKQKQPNK